MPDGTFRYTIDKHFEITVIYHWRPTPRHKVRVKRSWGYAHGFASGYNYDKAMEEAKENAVEKYCHGFVRDEVAFADVTVNHMPKKIRIG